MWGGCWGRCGDADACVLFIFDLLTRAADQNIHHHAHHRNSGKLDDTDRAEERK